MSNFNNINNITSKIYKALDAHCQNFEAMAHACDGGRKWRKSAIKNGNQKGINKYENPEYIEACRTDARRSIAIWSKY